MEDMGRSQLSIQNQASRQDSTSSLKSANHFRSKGSSNAKLTEERKNDILEILKNSIGSSKAAEVGNAKFIEELSKRMNAAVKDMRKWLGITDNLDEAVAKSNVRVQSKRASSNANLTEGNEFSERLLDLPSSKDEEVRSSKSIPEREVASKKKVEPNEMTKWLGIGDGVNEGFAHSTIRLHYKGSSDVQVTRNQKNEILEILRKGIGSCSGKDNEVGSSNSIQKMSIEVDLAGFEMQKLLGVTADFNKMIANSNAKVAQFEFQMQKSGLKNPEVVKIPLEDELSEGMTIVGNDIQSSAKMGNALNGMENSERIDQEPQEEDLASKTSVPKDIEELYLVQSDPLESDDDEVSSLHVEDSRSPKNLQDFDEEDAWELETSAEHLNPKLVKDISSLQNAGTQTDSSLKDTETQTDSSLKDAETQTEDSELSLTGLLNKPIKRKSRIDEYFPVLKKVKKA